jgi:hypothetical protein
VSRPPIPPADLARLAEAAEADPAAAFALAGELARPLIEHALFTATAFDPDRVEVERLWTSDPAVYPVGGRKKKRDTAWGRRVLIDRRMFVGDGEAAIRAAFDDAETILALGLRSVVNAPVVDHARCLGVLNFLARRERIGEDAAAAAAALASVMAPAFRR